MSSLNDAMPGTQLAAHSLELWRETGPRTSPETNPSRRCTVGLRGASGFGVCNLPLSDGQALGHPEEQ